MRSYLAILWQEFVLFKRKFRSITLGAMISPVLYLIAFGWSLGRGMMVGGHNYLQWGVGAGFPAGCKPVGRIMT